VTPRRLPAFAVSVALAAVLAIALIAQRTPTPQPARPAVSAGTVNRLRAENLELRVELVKQANDQLDLHRRLAQLEQRANRGSRRTTSVRRPVVIPGDDVWARLRNCESGGDYTRNTGNGFYGAYQFDLNTWGGRPDADGVRRAGAVTRAGYAEWANRLPSEAPPIAQDAAARRLQSERGWGPWPGCRAKLGLS
jgi:hypothetical protein